VACHGACRRGVGHSCYSASSKLRCYYPDLISRPILRAIHIGTIIADTESLRLMESKGILSSNLWI
jgi:hypothetical protein